MIKVLLYIFIVLLTTSFLLHEAVRANDAYIGCTGKFNANEALLHSSMCMMSLDEKTMYGPKVINMCMEARRENDIKPLECAVQTFWREGELFQLYNMFAKSHWMLLGVTVPALLFIIQQWFSARNAASAHESMKQLALNLREHGAANNIPYAVARNDNNNEAPCRHLTAAAEEKSHMPKKRKLHAERNGRYVELAQPFV